MHEGNCTGNETPIKCIPEGQILIKGQKGCNGLIPYNSPINLIGETEQPTICINPTGNHLP